MAPLVVDDKASSILSTLNGFTGLEFVPDIAAFSAILPVIDVARPVTPPAIENPKPIFDSVLLPVSVPTNCKPVPAIIKPEASPAADNPPTAAPTAAAPVVIAPAAAVAAATNPGKGIITIS